MTPTLETWVQRFGRGSLPARTALLLLAFALFWLAMVPAAWRLGGPAGLLASGLATLICLVAGWLAMIVTNLVAPPQNPVAHLGIGMALRMGLPLMACLVVVQRSEALESAGFAWYLIVAFLLGLLLETVMAVGQLKSVPN